MSFEDDLNAPVDAEWVDVDVLLNGTLHTLRFTPLDGLTWANECDKYPMRETADGEALPFDKAFGYDIRALTIGVAPLCGSLVEGDEVSPISPNQWDSLFARLGGGFMFKRITNAIWALNEHLPQEAVVEAKKALLASQRASASASSSASPQKGSSAGNRKKSPSTSTTTPDE